MSSPFVAEIRIFAGNFAPTGWATCDGQILPISQNTALFSLLGTTYGGNGQSTFALPNLQGSAPMHAGQGQGGLSQRFLGEQSGEQAVTLLVTEMPAHSHGAQATSGSNQDTPAANAWSTIGTTRTPPALYNSAQNVQMSPFALAITGASSPHNNMSPYQCLTFIIALQGVFPARN